MKCFVCLQAGQTTLNIAITDDNDNTPICAPSQYAVDVNEDQVVSFRLATIACTDADDGANAAITYRYCSQ